MKLNKNYLAIAISGLLGAIFCFIVFSNIINYNNVNWTYQDYVDNADTFQHHIGWEFFRASPWVFPIGIISNLGYPIGIPITYTDSIPLLAIPFKLIRNWLPQTFQYLGLWILLSYILQGVFGYLLSQLIFKNKITSIIASIFFIVSPIMLYRTGIHTSLTSHFLILASLYLIIRPHQALQSWHWGIIMCLALLIHPYFLFMIGPLWLADVFILLKDKKATAQKIIYQNFIIIFIIIIVAYTIGLFYIGAAAGEGYGAFSLNLNSVFSPQNYSKILPNLLQQRQQDDAFNYLGVGVIALFFTSVFIILKQKNKILRINFSKWFPLLFALLLLTLVAITNKIYFGNYKIIEFKLPLELKESLGIVRASGRIFWPVYYFIIFFALYGLRYLKTKYCLILLILFLSLQIFDVSGALKNKHELFSNNNWTSLLVSPIWQTLPERYTHISYIPNFNIAHQQYVSIDLFAIKNQLTINQGYFARMIKGGRIQVKKQIDDLKQGIVDPKTIYIFAYDIKNYLPLNNINQNYQLLYIDGFQLLLPN